MPFAGSHPWGLWFWGLGLGPRFAFLTSSKMMPMLLVPAWTSSGGYPQRPKIWFRAVFLSLEYVGPFVNPDLTNIRQGELLTFSRAFKWWGGEGIWNPLSFAVLGSDIFSVCLWVQAFPSLGLSAGRLGSDGSAWFWWLPSDSDRSWGILEGQVCSSIKMVTRCTQVKQDVGSHVAWLYYPRVNPLGSRANIVLCFCCKGGRGLTWSHQLLQATEDWLFSRMKCFPWGGQSYVQPDKDRTPGVQWILIWHSDWVSGLWAFIRARNTPNRGSYNFLDSQWELCLL